jgi:hypothetical protein
VRFAHDSISIVRRRAVSGGASAPSRVTHFVDDRLDVLSYVRASVSRLYWFTGDPARCPGWATVLPDWSSALSQIQP